MRRDADELANWIVPSAPMRKMRSEECWTSERKRDSLARTAASARRTEDCRNESSWRAPRNTETATAPMATPLSGATQVRSAMAHRSAYVAPAATKGSSEAIRDRREGSRAGPSGDGEARKEPALPTHQ